MAVKETGGTAGIRDVARMAGVAPSTVSRVLNNRGDGVRISPATIDRVRRAAQELRYKPNAAARSLRTTRSHTIGVIACDLLHPFSAELLRVFYASCQARGYHVLVGHAEHDSTEGRVLADILSADQVDGVLVIGDYLRGSDRQDDMAQLVQMHGHVVTVGARPSVAGELSILVDDARGVTMALDHLVALGHRSIGYVRRRHASTYIEPWEDGQRCAAYRRYLSAAGLPCTPAAESLVTNQVDQIEEIQAELRRLLALPQRPTAVFVNDDTTAIITLKAALTCGIRVPNDLSIVGFDDLPSSALYTPGLTTIRQPVDAMGRYAATALLDRIGGIATPEHAVASLDSNTLLFPPTLICRESTTTNARPAQGDAAASAG